MMAGREPISTDRTGNVCLWIFAPFLNIMNEWYVRDTSRKIKSVLYNKGMDGKHLTSNAIYGYKKDLPIILQSRDLEPVGEAVT